MSKPQPFPAWLEATKRLVAEKKLDLSSDEDLSLAVMNLISIEEHLFFSGVKTGVAAYHDLIQPIRKLRGAYLRQLLPDYEGEVWCICKHLLSAAMRLVEVGTKRQEKDPAAAVGCFRDAYTLYSYFWTLKLKMAVGGAAQPAVADLTASLPALPAKEKAVQEFLNKLVDCCGE